MKNPIKAQSVIEGSLVEQSVEDIPSMITTIDASNVQVVQLTVGNITSLLQSLKGHQVIPGVYDSEAN